MPPVPSPRTLLPAFRMMLLILAVLNLLWWRWADRRLRPLPRAGLWRALLGLFVLAMISTMVMPLLWPSAAQGPDGLMPVPLRMVQLLWHMVILVPFMIALAMVALAQLFARGIRWMGARIAARSRAGAPEPPAAGAQPQAGLTRRQFLGVAAVMLPPLALTAAVGISLEQLGKYRIRRIRTPVRGLPGALNGMTVAHVTDTHLGRFLQIGDLPKIVADANALGADLILLTGDLIDSGFGDLSAITSELKRLRPGVPGGLAMCVGNHDIMRDRARFVSEVKASGIPLLVDEALSLRVRGSAVQLLGLDWYRGDEAIRAGLQRVLRFRRPEEFPILLSHHPHAFDPAIDAGLPLTLSGHTHGGQLMLTDHIGAGPILFRYWSGLYRRNGCSLVVSNGVGNWFPLRTHAPAEIVLETLERADG